VRRAGWVAIGCAGAAGISGLVAYVLNWQSSGLFDALTTLLPVPISFACGLTTRRIVGFSACLWMTVVGEVSGFNPFVIVITLGPWLAGAVVRERQQVAHRLEEVGRELESESQLLAEESVRLERARIARELHDIVAHCVTVMVIQAYAGEKLMATDQASASEAFDHIASQADQAQQEIEYLVDLLDGEAITPLLGGSLSDALKELTAGAAAAGLEISVHLTGQPEQVSSDASAVAYRVVQEGVTNALKHAPGAPIVIVVDCSSQVTVDVVNGTGQVPVSGLGSSGGGHGLSGIRDRIAGLGGAFDAGPEPNGSWRVSVRFPAA
jgi:signal transduction histidine kinase